MWICRWPNFVYPYYALVLKSKLKTETMVLNNMEPEYPKFIITLRNTQKQRWKIQVSWRFHQTRSTKYRWCWVKLPHPNNSLLQNVKINLRTRVFFFNSFIRSWLVYSCQNWNLTTAQYERIDSTYRNLLRRMIRGSFNRVGENDYRLSILLIQQSAASFTVWHFWCFDIC